MRRIDADAFRRELDKHWPFTKEEQSKHGIADMAKSVVLWILADMPTIEPERKTGRWLPDNRPGGGFWVCSCCGFPSEAFAADKLYKYCPVCGCRMDEGEQDGR